MALAIALVITSLFLDKQISTLFLIGSNLFNLPFFMLLISFIKSRLGLELGLGLGFEYYLS